MQSVSGGDIEGRWQQALYPKKRPEYVADRLTKAFRGVLHARCLIGKAAIPCRTAPNPPMVKAAHQHERHGESQCDTSTKGERTVRGSVHGQRYDDPPRRCMIAKCRAQKALVYLIKGSQDDDGKESQSNAQG